MVTFLECREHLGLKVVICPSQEIAQTATSSNTFVKSVCFIIYLFLLNPIELFVSDFGSVKYLLISSLVRDGTESELCITPSINFVEILVSSW